MTKVYGSPFKIDWKDKEDVIAYAKRFGPGMSVVKYPSRNNYNITHTDREQAYPHCGIPEIIFRTGDA
jgi:hypothetical protein